MGEKARGPESPRLTANLFSKVLFWWLAPLFYNGKARDLTNKDLHDPLPEDISEQLGTRLEKHWRNELENARRAERKPKLIEAIKKAFGLRYFYIAVPMVVLSGFKVLQAFVLRLLIQSLESNGQKKPTEQAYIYGLSLVLLTLFHSLIKHHIDLANLEMGMQLRIACSSLIYRKTVKLSNASVSAGTGGQIVNLLVNDTARFDPLFQYLHYIWISPLQGTIVAYLIWQTVGMASLVGITIIIIGTVPVQVYIGKITSKLRGKIAAKTDERVRLMSEIINGIHVIKMYTWEKPFQYLVFLARRYEIDVITTMSYLKGINFYAVPFIDRVAVFFTIAAYTLMGNPISADKVFPMIQYFNIMHLLFVFNYPRAMSYAAEARVSIMRIEKFLMLEEIKIKAPILSIEDNARITLKSVTACWTPNSIVNTLHDITMNITPKKLHAVIGPVGSGKTSLIQVILGELPTSTGDLKINGTISYAPQRPWLFPGTIRENVIFDQLNDETRYRQVLKVCALERDLDRLPRGDLTQVGERGTNLSGGQCARINLARAVYRDADIYIFDDPLSAVDPSVCNSLFKDCIDGFLKDKTRLIVTQQAQCLKETETIFLLNNGKLESQGKFSDFSKKELKSLNILDEEGTENKSIPEEEIVGIMNNKNSNQNSLLKPFSANKIEETTETQELIAKGKMKTSIFWRYFCSGNTYFLLTATILCFLVAQSIRCGADYWLSFWTDHEKKYNKWYKKEQEYEELNKLISSTLPTSTESLLSNATESLLSSTTLNSLLNTVSSSTAVNLLSNASEKLLLNETASVTPSIEEFTSSFYHINLDTALIIYGCLTLGCIIGVVSKVLLFYKICMNSSKSIHEEMFSCVLNAPMRFFNKQTSGQILNRFSKDVGTMDEILPTTMYESIEVFSVTLGIIFFQVFIISWWSLLPTILTLFLYWKIKNYHIPTAYGIKRLEGAAKSPVLSYVTSSLEGLAIIRSSRGQTTVSRRFDARQDAHTRAYFLNIAVSSAFGLWLDLVSVIFVSFVTLNCVINQGNITTGKVGLGITQILMLCGMLARGIRQISETVTQMTSVERILQFTELEQEEDSDDANLKKPPSDWPSRGKIEFQNYSLKYTDDDVEPILKNVNILIEPGTKVGIVGRTGAGKSSLISALFRLARAEGQVLIDDLETRSLSLNELRRRLAIIPQEPVLFSTSLRDNLDPFHEFEDSRLWAALEDVQLQKAVPLDHPIECSGRNLSAGQRQLLCLARAMVKKTRILVLDEASANVDPATDSLIRETIHAKFQDCTVLTVAHRLESVVDNDMILVIDNGEVIEYDRPYNLLNKENGAFASMAKQGGDAMFDHFKKVAAETYNTRLRNQTSTAEVTVAEIEPTKVDSAVVDSETSTPEVTVEISRVSTPDDTKTDDRSSTPETAAVESQVSTPETTAPLDSPELSTEKKILTTDSADSEERTTANGLLKKSEIVKAVNETLEKS